MEKYKLTRNTPINGKIYPRGTIIPNKMLKLEGDWVQRLKNNGGLVAFDDGKVEVVKVNKEDTMSHFEKMNRANNFAQSSYQIKKEAVVDIPAPVVEAPVDVEEIIELVTEEVSQEVTEYTETEMTWDEIKAKAKELGISSYGKNKETLLEEIKTAEAQ
jgi:ABC-type Na+ efflux pump permease subunit